MERMPVPDALNEQEAQGAVSPRAAAEPEAALALLQSLRETHEQLAQSLALTKIASRLARLGAWTLELPDYRMTWSEENRAIHEVEPGEQPGLAEGLAMFDPEHREEVVRLVQQCARDGTPYEFEVPKTTARGRRIWVRSIGEAVRDASGRIVRLQGAFQDITERKNAEEALRRKDALLRIAGRVARIGGWAIDVARQRIEWSDEVSDILGFATDVRPGLRDCLRLSGAPARRRVVRSIAQCARDGAPFDLEAEITTRAGSRIWVRVIGEAEFDAGGAVRRVQGAVQDISERRALQEQLHQAQRLESVGRLTGGVAHDFNNLLTVILGNAEILDEELAGQPALQPLAQVVATAAQRGADLTQRLLAFARRQALEPSAVDVNRLVEGMDPIVRRALGHHIVTGFEPAPDLWPALVDPVQLDNTLLNLCLNARDAMPSGGRLSIRTANAELGPADVARLPEVRPGPYVMLVVSDTGTGIAPELLPRLFEPFFTTKPQGKGTGLGLAMAYGFIKQSGGHVDIQSTPGQGTQVRLYLPRADRAGAPAIPQAPREAARDPAGAARTILLVEDDDMVRHHAREQLLALGYAVREAVNGSQALDVLEGGQAVDLLFTDLVMPGMGGRQLADLARRLRPGLRVLCTSGYAEDALFAVGHPGLGLPLLAKPYRRDDLARSVRAALAG